MQYWMYTHLVRKAIRLKVIHGMIAKYKLILTRVLTTHLSNSVIYCFKHFVPSKLTVKVRKPQLDLWAPFY